MGPPPVSAKSRRFVGFHATATAWPIGVTMVGIHARKGREKIGESNVAHVMNDEEQRKYLTSIKRLMSFAQSRSAAPPSKRMG